MLSLTKKSEAQAPAAPRWHANFRDFERLPDTKVVRTTFFVNTAAIAAAVVMIMWLAYREYSYLGIQGQIAQAQAEIDKHAKQNSEAIRLSKQFVEEQKKIEEAIAFVKVPITPLEFVDLLGQTLPKEIIIDTVETRIGDARNSVFQIRGRAAGSPDQATGLASAYVDMLHAHPRIGALFDPITLNRVEREQTGTFLTFDITLTIKAEKK